MNIYTVMHRVIYLTFISFLLFSKKSYLHIIRLPECMFHGNFSIKYKNGKLNAGVANLISRKSVGTIAKDCMLHCVTTNGCKSVLHDTNSQDENCYLLKVNDGYPFAQVAGWNYYMTDESDSKNIGPTCESLRPCGQHEICNEQCSDPFYTCTPGPTQSATTATKPTTIATTSITDSYENIAVGKSIEMTSNYNNYGNRVAAHCNDKDIETICTSVSIDGINMIHISFERRYIIYHVTIRAQGDSESYLSRVNGFKIYIGTDENTPTKNELFATIQQTDVLATYSTENGEGMEGREFFIHGNGDKLSFSEIEVYGEET